MVDDTFNASTWEVCGSLSGLHSKFLGSQVLHSEILFQKEKGVGGERILIDYIIVVPHSPNSWEPRQDDLYSEFQAS